MFAWPSLAKANQTIEISNPPDSFETYWLDKLVEMKPDAAILLEGARQLKFIDEL